MTQWDVTHMTPADIATTIRYYRKSSGLSQQALAKLAGVGKTAIFDIEKGKQTVQLNTLLKVLEVLNIQITFVTPFTQTMESDT
jgi:HTH-type transcriptional regulator/antitoxin HipB